MRRGRRTRVVIENVPTFITTSGHRWKELCGGLYQLGVTIDYGILNAKDFGVPQARKRLYIVGQRNAKYEQKESTTPLPMADYKPRTATLRDIVER